MSKISSWIRNSENLQAYKAWLADPITRQVLEGIQEECTPGLFMPGELTLEQSAQLYQQHVGQHKALRMLQEVHLRDTQPNKLPDTVNVAEIHRLLKQQGHELSLDQVRKRLIEQNA